MNSINPKNVPEIVNDLSCNNENIINKFIDNHSKGILEFSELISECHKKLSLFENIKELTKRKEIVGGFIFLAIDNVYTSVKLLTLGYFVPSGNIMRQSTESICMALLLSHSGNLNLGTETKPLEEDFLQLYNDESSKARSYKSFWHVKRNKDILEVNEEALGAFQVNRNYYNGLSHPNYLSLAYRMVSENDGSFLFGGGYDENKKTDYDSQLYDRIKYTSIIPNFIEVMYSRVSNS